jgi:hypothetical protein
MSKGACLIERHDNQGIRASTGGAAAQRGGNTRADWVGGPGQALCLVGRLLKLTHKIAGADYAGRVESIGRDIKRFQPGDEVFGASFTGKGQGGTPLDARSHTRDTAPLQTSLLSDNSTRTANVDPRSDSLSRAYNIVVRCPC